MKCVLVLEAIQSPQHHLGLSFRRFIKYEGKLCECLRAQCGREFAGIGRGHLATIHAIVNPFPFGKRLRSVEIRAELREIQTVRGVLPRVAVDTMTRDERLNGLPLGGANLTSERNREDNTNNGNVRNIDSAIAIRGELAGEAKGHALFLHGRVESAKISLISSNRHGMLAASVAANHTPRAS